MDAVDALNEIAFWLERELAPTFKVQAFRKAAGIIAGLGPEELAARAADGRLRRTKGIGDRTYQVITEALDGDVPEYLGGLRSRGSRPLVPGGHELLASLRGDLHSHSDWSDGGSPIEAMVDAARLLGREYLALTDHSPNLKIANGLSAERLAEQLDIVAEINARNDGGFRLLRGIEADILEDGSLDQSPEMLDRLDIVVASVHSKLRADKRTMTRRMLGAIEDPHMNVLGHCTGRLIQGAGERVRRRSSTPARSSPPAPSTTSPSKSMPGLNARTRRGPSSRSPSTPAACSASTAMPTPRASSISCSTVPSARNATACRRSGSSPAGPWTVCWNGPRQPLTSGAHCPAAGHALRVRGKAGHSALCPVFGAGMSMSRGQSREAMPARVRPAGSMSSVCASGWT